MNLKRGDMVRFKAGAYTYILTNDYERYSNSQLSYAFAKNNKFKIIGIHSLSGQSSSRDVLNIGDGYGYWDAKHFEVAEKLKPLTFAEFM